MAGFASSVRANTQKQLAEVDTTIESMAVELFTEVVNLSPIQPAAKYAKGQFVNNWMAVANGSSTTTVPYTSMSGDASRAQITSLKGMKTFLGKDGYVTLSNSLPYAYLVEYAGWPKEINPRWTGTVGPYAPVRNAWTKVIPKFKNP